MIKRYFNKIIEGRCKSAQLTDHESMNVGSGILLNARRIYRPTAELLPLFATSQIQLVTSINGARQATKTSFEKSCFAGNQVWDHNISL